MVHDCRTDDNPVLAELPDGHGIHAKASRGAHRHRQPVVPDEVEVLRRPVCPTDRVPKSKHPCARWSSRAYNACKHGPTRQTDRQMMLTTYLKLSFLLGRFPAIANHGRHFRSVPVTARNPVPDGPQTRTPGINDAFWQNVWQDATALPSAFGNIRQPDRFVNEQIGSNTNPTPFVILRDAVNAVKGRLEMFRRPMAEDNFQDFVNAAVVGDEPSVESFMAPLREVSLACRLF